jgi:hypothetical protein
MTRVTSLVSRIPHEDVPRSSPELPRKAVQLVLEVMTSVAM